MELCLDFILWLFMKKEIGVILKTYRGPGIETNYLCYRVNNASNCANAQDKYIEHI